MKDITVMNSPPMSVTAHSGMLSKNPHSSMLVIKSGGKTVCGGFLNTTANSLAA